MDQKIGLLTASQRRRIEAAEMKLLRPLVGYTLHEHKTNDYIRLFVLILVINQHNAQILVL